MAFGFPAYHEETRKFELKRNVLASAVENALVSLEWQFNRDSSGSQFNARTGWSIWSYMGEKVKIEVRSDGSVRVRSECGSPIQCVDYGKNKKNVEQFLDALSQTLGK